MNYFHPNGNDTNLFFIIYLFIGGFGLLILFLLLLFLCDTSVRDDEATIMEEHAQGERRSTTSQIKSLWRMLKTKFYNCSVMVGENMINIAGAVNKICGRRGEFIIIE